MGGARRISGEARGGLLLLGADPLGGLAELRRGALVRVALREGRAARRLGVDDAGLPALVERVDVGLEAAELPAVPERADVLARCCVRESGEDAV